MHSQAGISLLKEMPKHSSLRKRMMSTGLERTCSRANPLVIGERRRESDARDQALQCLPACRAPETIKPSRSSRLPAVFPEHWECGSTLGRTKNRPGLALPLISCVMNSR